MKKQEFIIPQKVSFERVAEVLCGAVDPGYEAISYWGEVRGKKAPKSWEFDKPPVWTTAPEAEKNKDVHYRHYYPLNEGGALIIRDNEAEGAQFTLDSAALERGLQLMATKYPKHFADIIEENDDGDTSDALVQLSIFGDVIYG